MRIMEEQLSEMRQNPLEGWIFGKTGGKSILEYQLERIKDTFRLVTENSAFYSKRYCGFQYGRTGCINDFERLPFVTAEDIVQYGPQMLCVHQNEIERIVTLKTSGTAGEPKRVYFTAADQELTIDFFDVGMRCIVDEKDNFMILLPYKAPGSVGDLLRAGLERIGCSVYPYGIVEDYRDAGGFIQRNNITSLVGTPVQVLKLAELTKAYGLDIELSSVLLSADFVPDAVVRRLESLWKCKVFEHYGMTEMCFGGGVYCDCLAGYHMREADLYFEIISDSGESLPDGEYGEIVFTTLTRKGMPLVRYRTGDYGRFKRERCCCSAELRVMEKVRRRMDGGISIGNRIFHISDFDEMMFSCDKIVDYSIAFDKGEISIKAMTAGDVMVNESKQERLVKRKILKGGGDEASGWI